MVSLLRCVDKTIDYLNIVRENPSNSKCADCNCEDPTIAIMSWLLVVCKKCAGKKLSILLFCFILFFDYSQLFINP